MNGEVAVTRVNVTGRCSQCPPAGTWRVAWHDALDHPGPSLAHRCLMWVSCGALLVSSVAVVLETLPSWRALPVWRRVDAAVAIAFSAELAVRLLVARPAARALLHPWHVLDALACVPWYLERHIGHPAVALLRILRIARLPRMLMFFQGSRLGSWSRAILLTLLRARGSLAGLVLYIVLALVIACSFLFVVERGTLDEETGVWRIADGRPSSFQSVPETFWLGISAVTTTGCGDAFCCVSFSGTCVCRMQGCRVYVCVCRYGDVAPLTTGGRLLVSLLVLWGILVLALPMTILSSFFRDAYKESAVSGAADTTPTQLLRRLEASRARLAERFEALNHDLDQVCSLAPPSLSLSRLLVLFSQSKLRLPVVSRAICRSPVARKTRSVICSVCADVWRVLR